MAGLSRCLPSRYEADWGPLPERVESSVLAFLRCRDFHTGFTRLRCRDCGHELLLPLTCKQRGLCASCHQRPALDEATFIADTVCARVPHRHLVFTVHACSAPSSSPGVRLSANSASPPAMHLPMETVSLPDQLPEQVQGTAAQADLFKVLSVSSWEAPRRRRGAMPNPNPSGPTAVRQPESSFLSVPLRPRASRMGQVSTISIVWIAISCPWSSWWSSSWTGNRSPERRKRLIRIFSR